jgi:hypothetical protein
MRCAAIIVVLLCCQLLPAQAQPASAHDRVKNGELQPPPGPLSPGPARSAFVLTPPQPVRPAAARDSWRGFWALTTAATALTIADVELSQACLQQAACTEANPLLPRSRAAAYAVQLPLAAAATLFSYHLKKHRAKRWWVPQFGLLLGHSIGAGSGARMAF